MTSGPGQRLAEGRAAQSSCASVTVTEAGRVRPTVPSTSVTTRTIRHRAHRMGTTSPHRRAKVSRLCVCWEFLWSLCVLEFLWSLCVLGVSVIFVRAGSFCGLCVCWEFLWSLCVLGVSVFSVCAGSFCGLCAY